MFVKTESRFLFEFKKLSKEQRKRQEISIEHKQNKTNKHKKNNIGNILVLHIVMKTSTCINDSNRCVI